MDNSSVAEEGNGDLNNAVAASHGTNNNNNTPISSPQRAPPSRSPRKTPTSHNRPKKTQKQSDILKIDDDVMHKNNDAREDGNIDGGGIDLPLDISNIFDASIDNNISTDGTTNVDDGDLFSALSTLVMEDGSSSTSPIHTPRIPPPPSIPGISPRTTAMDIRT